MLVVYLLALVGEVALEEGVEEFLQHGVVHASAPGEVREELEFGFGDAPPHGFHRRAGSKV